MKCLTAHFIKTALDLFFESAQLGYKGAAFKAGLLYENGQGTRKNMKKARYWMKKAAENGLEFGMHNLTKKLTRYDYIRYNSLSDCR